MRRSSVLRWFGFIGLFVSISLSMGQAPQQGQGGFGGKGQGGNFGGGGFGGGGFPGGGGGGFGGGGGRGGKGGGGRGGNFDPSMLFDMMAKGQPVVNRANLDERGQGMFDRFAGGMGITNGVMTRDQFTQGMAAMGGGGAGGRGKNKGGGMPGGGGWGGAMPGGGFGGGGSTADPMAGVAEMQFRRLDVNGDGVLNYDEMSEALRAEKDRWDANKDGFIDLAEFKSYLQARVQQVIGEGSDAAGGVETDIEKGEEEKRPIIYRAGRLPKELPEWFAQLDTDKDAQIGVYEWKKSGRSFEEFDSLDRNGDGYLTVEEVLHANKGSGAGGEGRMVVSMGGGDGVFTRNYSPEDGTGSRMQGRGGPKGGGKNRDGGKGKKGGDKGSRGGDKKSKGGRGGPGGGVGGPGAGMGGAGGIGALIDEDI